jgi:hypothetical protein
MVLHYWALQAPHRLRTWQHTPAQGQVLVAHPHAPLSLLLLLLLLLLLVGCVQAWAQLQKQL